MTPNEFAFLQMLSISEGTYGHGDNGYNVLVGGGLFTTGYEDHPRILVPIPRLGISSSAAGRYQLLARYFDIYKALIPVPDFGPDSQDTIALQQIKESGAQADVRSGNVASAIAKCAHIWASLPGNNYGQGSNSLEMLESAFLNAGGVFSPTETVEA